MRNIVFFLFLILLIFFLYWFRGNIVNFLGFPKDMSIGYSEIFQDALHRNSRIQGSESVIFSQADMESGGGIDTTFGNQENNSIFSESEFNNKQIQLYNTLPVKNGGITPPQLPNGDFGALLPDISLMALDTSGRGNPTFDGAYASNGECHGIIFDPCIILKDMGNQRPLWFEMAPIYPYYGETIF